METAKAARERRTRAPEELTKKTRARNSGAIGMRPRLLSRRAKGFAPRIPSFDSQANWETDMILRALSCRTGSLTCPQRYLPRV